MEIFKIKLVIVVEYQSQHRNAFDGWANINVVCIAQPTDVFIWSVIYYILII